MNVETKTKTSTNVRARTRTIQVRALVTVVGALIGITVIVCWRMLQVEAPQNAEWLLAEVVAVNRDRLIVAVVVGMCLGVAGVLLRTATKNPLADPDIVGVNSGAAFGAVAASAFSGNSGSLTLLPWALLGATVAGAITVFFGLRGSATQAQQISVQRMVLLGIAVSALFSALTSIALVLDEAQLATVLSWLSGKLAGVRLSEIWAALVCLIILLPLMVMSGKQLDTLTADEQVATAFGAKPALLRLLAIVGAIILIAPCVAATGPIGFLGLMAATAAHRVCGVNHRWALPVAGLLGAFVLLLADIVGQAVWAPAETPVGIITAIAGVPVLLWGINHMSKKS